MYVVQCEPRWELNRSATWLLKFGSQILYAFLFPKVKIAIWIHYFLKWRCKCVPNILNDFLRFWSTHWRLKWDRMLGCVNKTIWQNYFGTSQLSIWDTFTMQFHQLTYLLFLFLYTSMVTHKTQTLSKTL